MIDSLVNALHMFLERKSRCDKEQMKPHKVSPVSKPNMFTDWGDIDNKLCLFYRRQPMQACILWHISFGMSKKINKTLLFS